MGHAACSLHSQCFSNRQGMWKKERRRLFYARRKVQLKLELDLESGVQDVLQRKSTPVGSSKHLLEIIIAQEAP
jgi:hypothetical protein